MFKGPKLMFKLLILNVIKLEYSNLEIGTVSRIIVIPCLRSKG